LSVPRCAATPSSAGSRDPWPKALTAAQQFINLRANPVSSGDGVLHAGSFAWTYETTPSALSRVYRIRIEVDHDLSPDVSSRTRISANSQVDAVFLTSTRTGPSLPLFARSGRVAALDETRPDNRPWTSPSVAINVPDVSVVPGTLFLSPCGRGHMYLSR
jgi:hypothetical protein